MTHTVGRALAAVGIVFSSMVLVPGVAAASEEEEGGDAICVHVDPNWGQPYPIARTFNCRCDRDLITANGWDVRVFVVPCFVHDASEEPSSEEAPSEEPVPEETP